MNKLKNTDLEHVTPESVGVKSSAIKAFIDEINEKKLGLQSFTVVRHGRCAPNASGSPMRQSIPTYSIQ